MPLPVHADMGLGALLAGLDAVAARVELLRALREEHTAAGLLEVAAANRVSRARTALPGISSAVA